MAAIVYRANNSSAARAAVFGALKEHRGERNIVIVPDEYSFTTEREVLKALGTSCAFDAQVLSFGRLADKTVGRPRRLLNKQTSVILMRRVIIENADKLECYREASKMRGFAREMYAVITNIRNSGVKPDELKRIVPMLSGGMRKKTKDIALIYSAYSEYLNEYCDMTGMLERLLERLENDDEAAAANFYITDFYDMADIKLKIVEVLLKRADNVYLGLIKRGGRNGGLSAATDRIAALAEALGAKCVELENALDEDKLIAADNLFCYGINALKDGSDCYSLVSLPSLMHELEYVAEDIRRRVTRENKRYKDFAIVLPDVRRDANRVKRVLTRYGIPFYIDEGYELINHTLYRVLREGLAARSLNRQDVLSFVKEAAFIADDGLKEQFENYCLAANIDGAAFLKPFPNAAESVRAKLTALIEILVGEAENAEAYASLIRSFYTMLGEYVPSDDGVDGQIYGKIEECLESVTSIFDGLKASRSEYDDALFIALESVKISTVPLYIDSLFVGGANDSRFNDIDTMYVIGANDGAYPDRQSDGGIVRDAECEEWARHGVIIQAAADRDRANKLNIIETLLKPRRAVISSVAGKPDALAKLQLKKAFNLSVLSPRFTYAASAEAIAEHMASPANYMRELYSGRVYVEGVEAVSNRADEYAVAADAFYNGGVSPSSIEKFYSCPYRYFVDKVLRIKKRDVAEESAQLLGTFLHDVLERYYKKYGLSENDIDTKAAETCVEVLADEAYGALVRSGDCGAVSRMLTARAVYTVKALDAEFSRGVFKPKYLEYTFGYENTDPGLEFEVGGRTYSIAGKADRVDEAEIIVDGKPVKCIAVIDYKSSVKETGGKALEEGSVLQLPVYTAITARNQNAVPAAMLYAAMPAKYIKGGGAPGCTGFVLDREEYLSALDRNYTDYADTHLPFRTCSSRPRRLKGAVSGEELRAMLDNAVEMMKRAVGIICSEPLLPTGDKACDYCEYSRICRKDEFEKQRAEREGRK